VLSDHRDVVEKFVIALPGGDGNNSIGGDGGIDALIAGPADFDSVGPIDASIVGPEVAGTGKDGIIFACSFNDFAVIGDRHSGLLGVIVVAALVDTF